MKHKILTITVLFLFLGTFNAFAVPGTAQENSDNPGTAIELTDNVAAADGGPNELTLNFSPSVAGYYIADGDATSGQVQWYAVATYHSGGSSFYATSSDSTTTYSQVRGTNQTFGDVTIPDTPVLDDDGDPDTPDIPADEYWTGNGWVKK